MKLIATLFLLTLLTTNVFAVTCRGTVDIRSMKLPITLEMDEQIATITVGGVEEVHQVYSISGDGEIRLLTGDGIAVKFRIANQRVQSAELTAALLPTRFYNKVRTVLLNSCEG